MLVHVSACVPVHVLSLCVRACVRVWMCDVWMCVRVWMCDVCVHV